MIRIYKLINGIEVVGDQTYVDPAVIIVKRPLQINYRYYTGPSPSVSFVRYFMFGDSDQIALDRKTIVSESGARASFVDVYKQHAKFYYEEQEKIVDKELSLSVDKPSIDGEREEESMKKFLEMLSIEGAIAN